MRVKMTERLGRRTVIALVLLLLLLIPSEAKPLYRRKRVSDQRLAELETLLALERMRGKSAKVQVGFGRIDPLRLGRRKRESIRENERNEEDQCPDCKESKNHLDVLKHIAAGYSHQLFQGLTEEKTDSSNSIQFPVNNHVSQRANSFELRNMPS